MGLPGNLGRLALVIGIAVSIGAAGCFLAKEDVGSTEDQVTAGSDVSGVLKSTLVIEGAGCSAVKVGPRHLLLAARCVADKPAFEAGKTINFKAATEQRTLADNEDGVLDAGAPKDAGGTKTDAGKTDAGKTDAGKTDAGTAPNRSGRTATIEEVKVHASYTAKCTNNACAFTALGASDAKDIAVLILDADLESIPTIPVDLDTVGQSDPVLVVGSGCTKIDGTPSGTIKTYKTIAVPAKSVNHVGSPYVEQPALTTRLGGAYVVTPGIGWREDEPQVCNTDIGSPVFRGTHAAVAGITSNFTTYETTKTTPVTLHHTRVDTTSKVGAWLETLGVETTHTCSEAEGGCVKKDYTGGAPSPTKVDGTTNPGGGDASAGDAKAPKLDAGETEEVDAGEGEPPNTDLPSQGTEAPLPESTDTDSPRGSSSGSDDDGDSGTKKKKKKEAEGCSAAPGGSPANGGMILGFGLVLAAAAARRRRQQR